MAKHTGTDQDLMAMTLIGYEAQKAKLTEEVRKWLLVVSSLR